MIRVFEPQHGDFADLNTGVVLFNHFGSTVAQDTGRDAQVLADDFGLPVLGVDRPGSGGYFPNRCLAARLSDPDGYVAEMAVIGRAIDHRAESLGLNTIIATGRSAGGLGALVLARSETVSGLSYLMAIEPIGCEDVQVTSGFKRFKQYQKYQKSLLNDSPPETIIKPQPTGLGKRELTARSAAIGIAYVTDKFHNKQIFTSTAAIKYASHIAEYQPHIDTTLEFAQHSLVVTDEIYKSVIQPLTALRTGGKPFEVRRPDKTVHASFDNRRYMSRVLNSVIARALLR